MKTTITIFKSSGEYYDQFEVDISTTEKLFIPVAIKAIKQYIDINTAYTPIPIEEKTVDSWFAVANINDSPVLVCWLNAQGKSNQPETFETLEKDMKGCFSGDAEFNHSYADICLARVALSTTLTKEERKVLVNLWRSVTKHYA